MTEWIINNWIEIVGFLAGIIYIFLEIGQKKSMWPVGILTSAFYVVVFYDNQFYADMGLMFFYIGISIYGWYWWSVGGKSSSSSSSSSNEELRISRISIKQFIYLSTITVALFAFISYILISFTDSPIPYWDSFTTALSITATWMLARKILEQWLVWIIVNAVSICLYVYYKDLYLTSILYLVYSIMAVVGFIEWKKNYLLQSNNNE